MILTELFDQPLPYTLNTQGIGRFVTASGLRYDVDFMQDEDDHGSVDLLFTQVGPIPRNNITNTGDEFAIFGTIVGMIREYIATHEVRQLTFDANVTEPSRVKLYDRMVKSLAPGWDMKTTQVMGTKKYVLINPTFNANP